MKYTVKDIRNIMNKCNRQLGKICTIEEHPEILKEDNFDLKGFIGETAQCLTMSAYILSLVIDNTKVDFKFGGDEATGERKEKHSIYEGSL